MNGTPSAVSVAVVSAEVKVCNRLLLIGERQLFALNKFASRADLIALYYLSWPSAIALASLIPLRSGQSDKLPNEIDIFFLLPKWITLSIRN